MASILNNFGLLLIILVQISYIRSLPTGTLIDEILSERDDDDDIIDLSRFGDAIYGNPDERVGRMVDEWKPDSDVNAEELGTYLEGDILIPNTEGRNGLVKESSKWTGNVIPYVFHGSISSGDRGLILEAIDEYHRKTCLKFKPRTTERDYLSFESSSSGCWSSVGRIGGKQSVNLQSGGCTRKGTILHEIMHALGFLHEQNRFERDDFVIIKSENIKPETLPNFEKAKYGTTTAYGVPYDKGSVMHYSKTAFSRNGQPTIVPRYGGGNEMGQRTGFSRSDLLRINARYKCNNQIVETNYGGSSVPRPPSPPRPDQTGQNLMGQRKGFAKSDLDKIRNRYCSAETAESSESSETSDRHPAYIDYNGIDPGYPLYPEGPPFIGSYGSLGPYQPQRPPFAPYPPPRPGLFGRPPFGPPIFG